MTTPNHDGWLNKARKQRKAWETGEYLGCLLIFEKVMGNLFRNCPAVDRGGWPWN